MRDRNLLHLFLALNVALAAAFVTYLFLSNNSQPKVLSTDFTKAQKTNLSVRLATNSSVEKITAPSNSVAGVKSTNSAPGTNISTNVAPVAVFTQKKFDWNDVATSEYARYMQSLRAVGCPEEKVRSIVLGDIDELFQHKKLKLALELDQQWWKPQSEYLMVNVMQERGRALEEERQALTE